jgi:selenocysteine lyase/cysteine desulfurase
MEQSRRDFIKTVGKVAAGLSLASAAGIQPPLTSGVQKASACSSGPVDWQDIRDNYFNLSRDYIYMNNSTMGPTLVPVSDRMAEVQKIFSQGCTIDTFNNEIVMTALPQLREEMRILVNADVYTPSYPPDSPPTPGKCVGNVDSVTEGMSLVANGLDLLSGDVIIYTDHEHAGGRTMWELKRDRYSAICGIPTPDPNGNIGTMVPLLVTPDDTEDNWAKNLVDRFIATIKYNNKYRGTVKVVSIPWITTSTGHVLPVKDLCDQIKLLDQNIICVIDGAQAFTIIPMDLQKVKCDFLVVNGHKYLCGPIGSGFIVADVARLGSSSSWPTVVDDQVYKAFGNTNAHSNCHRKGGLSAYTNILPLYDALTFYEGLGVENVYNRLLQIGQWLRDGLSTFPDNFKLITPMSPGLSCVMTCFQLWENKTSNKLRYSEDICQALKDQYGIQVKHSTEGYTDTYTYWDPNTKKNITVVNGAVRLAPHYYNTGKEFKKLAKALCAIAGVDYKSWPVFPG